MLPTGWILSSRNSNAPTTTHRTRKHLLVQFSVVNPSKQTKSQNLTLTINLKSYNPKQGHKEKSVKVWWLYICMAKASKKNPKGFDPILCVLLPAWSMPASPLEEIKAWKSAPSPVIKKYTNRGHTGNIFVRPIISAAQMLGYPFGTDGKSNGNRSCVRGSTSVSQPNVWRWSLLLYRVEDVNLGNCSSNQINCFLQKKNQKLVKNFLNLAMWIHSGSQTQGSFTEHPKPRQRVLRKKNYIRLREAKQPL